MKRTKNQGLAEMLPESLLQFLKNKNSLSHNCGITQTVYFSDRNFRKSSYRHHFRSAKIFFKITFLAKALFSLFLYPRLPEGIPLGKARDY